MLVAMVAVLASATLRDEFTGVTRVNLEKQNVVYVGVDNPVSISIAGVAPTDIAVELTGGSIRYTARPGFYIINVSGGTVATLRVYSLKDSVRYPAGVFDFRIKKIPDPVTYVRNVSNDGVMPKEEIKDITGISQRMVDFDFDVSFTPVSFCMSVIEEGKWKEYKTHGGALSAEMKAALEKAQENDKIIFHDVMTKGPDRGMRHVNGVTITVK